MLELSPQLDSDDSEDSVPPVLEINVRATTEMSGADAYYEGDDLER